MKLSEHKFFPDSGWVPPLDGSWNHPQTLALAFGAPSMSTHRAPFATLQEALPAATLTGCSTAGEIAGAEVDDDSISLVLARFERVRVQRAATPVAGATDSRAAGARLAQQLLGAPGYADLRAVFVLSDGLNVNGTALVEGLASALPEGVDVSGGLAGDGSRFGQTWVLDGHVARTGHVCAVGFFGPELRVGHGCGGGWNDFGPERRITRARDNVLYELDGVPALELYKRYLGERAAGLPGTALLFPLAIRHAGADGGRLIRTVLAVNESDQSMTFAGDIPEEGVARLMRTSHENLIDSAGSAAASAMQALPPSGAALALSVSCVGRRLVLGERTEEEVEAVHEQLNPGSVHAGFYSYGEISPLVPRGSSALHNQTMTVTVFAEA
jgi:hypothetical protein